MGHSRLIVKTQQYDAGVALAPDSDEHCVPSVLTRSSLARPRRIGWVPAGNGHRRPKFGGSDRVTIRTETFVLATFDFLPLKTEL